MDNGKGARSTDPPVVELDVSHRTIKEPFAMEPTHAVPSSTWEPATRALPLLAAAGIV